MKRLLIMLLAISGITSCATTNMSKERRQIKKEMKAEQYCEWMDSLVQSGVYTFRPQNMRVMPAGRNNNLRNINYRIDVREDFVQVYLPFIRGSFPPYRTVTINQTIPYISQYRSERSDDGKTWAITFSNNLFTSDTFDFKFTVATCTGIVELEISSPRNSTVVYSGFLQAVY